MFAARALLRQAPKAARAVHTSAPKAAGGGGEHLNYRYVSDRAARASCCAVLAPRFGWDDGGRYLC